MRWRKLRDGLKLLGYDVVCTRESDISIYDKGTEGLGEQKKSDMKNRLAIFSKYSDGISVSIHQNQFTDSRYSGAQMFYSKDNAEGEKLAGVMQKQFVSLLQPDNTRETKPVGDELYLLNNTKNPAVMIECGFFQTRRGSEIGERGLSASGGIYSADRYQRIQANAEIVHWCGGSEKTLSVVFCL